MTDNTFRLFRYADSPMHEPENQNLEFVRGFRTAMFMVGGALGEIDRALAAEIAANSGSWNRKNRQNLIIQKEALGDFAGLITDQVTHADMVKNLLLIGEQDEQDSARR